MDFYNILVDEKELEWFFNNVVSRPSDLESYLVCISARNKKLSPEEKIKFNLGRGEMMREEIISPKGKDKTWNFNIFKSAIYKYNCDKRAMITRTGLFYPDKCLVCYFYPNPSSEIKVVESVVNKSNEIKSQLMDSVLKHSEGGIIEQLRKLTTISKHMKSVHASALSRKIYIQFDFDFREDLKENKEAIKEARSIILCCAKHYFGIKNYFLIRTAGGYHLLVKKETLRFNPSIFIDDVIENYSFTFAEVVKTPQEFLPLPGTIQYNKIIVRVENKEDYEN